MDDDDEWHPMKLELQQRALDSDSEVGLVYTHIDVLNENGKHMWFNQCQVEGNALKEALFGGFIFTTSSVMLRKSILDTAGLFDENLPAMQDTDMWIRCCQITRVAVVPEVLTKYYIFTSVNGSNAREQIGSSTGRYLDAADKIEEKYASLYRQYTKKENKERISIIMSGLAGRAKRNHEKQLMRYCAGISLKNKFSKIMLKTYLISYLPGDLAFTLRKRIKAVLAVKSK